MVSVYLSSVCCLIFWLSLEAFGNFPKTSKGLKFGECLETGKILAEAELTLDACKTECLKRKKCKSLRYDRKYQLCVLYDSIGTSSNNTCPGHVYVDIGELIRPAGCDSCADNEVCVNDNSCEIKECSKPLIPPNSHYLGNLHSVGSKRQHVCSYGYKLAPNKTEAKETVVCNQEGIWEPEINECLSVTRYTVKDPDRLINTNTLQPAVGAWTPEQLCPNGSYASGYTMKIRQYDAGDGWAPYPDNTALTAVRLTCKDQHGNNTGEITSGVATCEGGTWGTSPVFCTTGQHLTSFKLQVDHNGVQVFGSPVLDQTGVNYMSVRCRDLEGINEETEIPIPPGNGHTGSWGEWSNSCSVNSAVCGIKTMLKDGKPDCLGMVDISLWCCSAVY